MASYFRFQLNRHLRKIRQRIYIWRVWLVNYAQRHIFGGWQKLGKSRWVFIAWLVICSISLFGLWNQLNSVNAHFLASAPASGGTYSEGVVGTVKSLNPLFPDNSATADISSVIFSGLTKVGQDRQIKPDLAEFWDISPDKKTYTFHLRNNLKWHDGTELTADDIAFTISRIQNPDTRSPLASNWSGVKYEVLNKQTIKLILPNTYSSFLYNATLGILPKHLLENVKPAFFRTNEFNQKPIGSGPYKISNPLENEQTVELTAFESYYQKKPYIENLQFVSYENPSDYLQAYQKKQILGFAVNNPDLEKDAKKIDDLKIHHLSLPAYSALFINTKSPVLSNVVMRQALSHAVDKKYIVENVLNNQALVGNYPILAGYSGFDASATKYEYNPQKSKELITQVKSDQLNNTTMRLVTLKDSTYENVANNISKMFSDVGIKVNVIAVSLEELQQRYIRARNYDILLYGQDLGYDSDIYAYWHSTQSTDPGLNLSQYSNPEADRLLETGRVAKDPEYKATRYSSFLQTWSKDVPAIILYTPYYDYAQNQSVKGLTAKKLVEPSNRFLDIQNWYIKSKLELKAKVIE